MLNQRTINYVTNKLSCSIIKYNITKQNTNLDFENESTASKDLFKKRGIDLGTRNALSSINNMKYALNKYEIKSLSLIGQFDKKFCVFYRIKDKSIIFFDQHAVHERILYEYYQELLLNQFFNNRNIISNNVKLNLFNDIYGKYILKKNNIFSVKASTYNINMENFNKSFLFNQSSNIQTFFNFSWSYLNDTITFFSVPIIFDKIHKIEILMDIFGYIINNFEKFWNFYLNKKNNILEPFDLVIKSKACRNAVKFNDELSNEFIKSMINELSYCYNPFLCAHGRHNYYIKYKKC